MVTGGGGVAVTPGGGTRVGGGGVSAPVGGGAVVGSSVGVVPAGGDAESAGEDAVGRVRFSVCAPPPVPAPASPRSRTMPPQADDASASATTTRLFAFIGTERSSIGDHVRPSTRAMTEADAGAGRRCSASLATARRQWRRRDGSAPVFRPRVARVAA